MRKMTCAIALTVSLSPTATMGQAQPQTASAGYTVIGEMPTDEELNGRFVEIKRGDTLAEIAQNAQVRLTEVARANPALNPRKMKPGELVKLPRTARNDTLGAFDCPGDNRCPD